MEHDLERDETILLLLLNSKAVKAKVFGALLYFGFERLLRRTVKKLHGLDNSAIFSEQRGSNIYSTLDHAHCQKKPCFYFKIANISDLYNCKSYWIKRTVKNINIIGTEQTCLNFLDVKVTIPLKILQIKKIIVRVIYPGNLFCNSATIINIPVAIVLLPRFCSGREEGGWGSSSSSAILPISCKLYE